MLREPVAPSIQTFALDLRRIRTARGLSLTAIQERTKILDRLLEQFEETALVDHPHFNRVYQRAFVRLYAEAVGIAQALALRAFEEALDGSYQGRLAAEYLPGDSDTERTPRRSRDRQAERRNGIAEAA